MGRLGTQSTSADRQFALALVGMGVVMSLDVSVPWLYIQHRVTNYSD